MTQPMINSLPMLQRQRGVVLVLGMFFLLVVTIIGLVAMRTATLENMMAANNQFGVAALSDAEILLNAAEADIDAFVSDGTTLDFMVTNDPYHEYGQIDPRVRDWTFGYATVSAGQYAVEYAGEREIPGETAAFNEGAAGSFVFVFLTDVRSEGAKGTLRTLQSVYVTSEAP